MDRTYPRFPLLGVSAAIWRDDKVLLVKRGKQPLKDYWSLPGGLVHTGEQLENAVIREVFEETGVTASFAGIADTTEIIHPDDQGIIAHHYVILAFAARWVSGEAVAGDDAAAVRWTHPDQLSALLLTDGTDRTIGKTANLLNGL